MSGKKYRLRYLPAAQMDLEDIIDYIMDDNPEAARSLVAKFDKALSRLESHPESCPVPADDRLRLLGYRILVVDNYVVFYVIKGRNVEVRRVIHGSRRYEFLL